MDSEDTIMQHTVELCKRIATMAHEGITRKFGSDKDKPYIIHPKRMTQQADSYFEECVCWLHDVIEDTDTTRFDLLDHGVDEDIIKAVESVTRIDGEEYLDFILRSKEHPIGRSVKILDINDNLQSLKKGSLRDKYLMALYLLRDEEKVCRCSCHSRE